MFRSYLVLFQDYFLSLKSNVYFDVCLPAILCVVIGYFLFDDSVVLNVDIVNNIIATLGVLAGFSLTAVSMLTTTDSPTTAKLKQKCTGNVVREEDISAFRQFYILVSYSILISLMVIVANSIATMMNWSEFITNKRTISMLKALDIFLVLHIFLVNIRNITYLYFIYYDETNIAENTNQEE